MWSTQSSSRFRPKGSIKSHWVDHSNWLMHHTARLARENEESAWELAGVYTFQLEKETRICFILKRNVLL